MDGLNCFNGCGFLGELAGIVQLRHRYGDDDQDNRDNDQELNEREASAAGVRHHLQCKTQRWRVAFEGSWEGDPA